MKWLCKIKHNWYRFPEPNEVEKSVKYCKRCGKILVFSMGGPFGHWTWVLTDRERSRICKHLSDNNIKHIKREDTKFGG